MASGELKLEIISPAGEIFKGNCHMAVVPSELGDLGVMFEHEAVIVSLREGQVVVYDENQNIIKSVEVKSGFAEVQDGGKKLLVLVS